MKSIMQDEKKCYVCGDVNGLQKHHIFGAFNRDNSEKYGLWVWLRWDYHLAASDKRTPHNDKQVDLMLKREAQRRFEKIHGHEMFMQIFGRNYL